MAAKKTPPKSSSARKPAARPAAPRKPAAKPAVKPAARRPARGTGAVLSELKSLAKELNKAAKGLTKKRSGNNPKDVSTVLGNVERMTAEAATKSLIEAESAKVIVSRLSDSLGRDWSRKDIEASLKELGGHLTNIIVAQEFQDLAGQSIRHALKALVGAIIVTEGGGPTEEGRLSQTEVDSLLKDLMS
jgi:chemotaxis regulatin CheY-phosphate phosphatase CheZ